MKAKGKIVAISGCTQYTKVSTFCYLASGIQKSFIYNTHFSGQVCWTLSQCTLNLFQKEIKCKYFEIMLTATDVAAVPKDRRLVRKIAVSSLVIDIS
jgi:hypothetical protein